MSFDSPLPPASPETEAQCCRQCGAPLTAKGNCSRTVASLASPPDTPSKLNAILDGLVKRGILAPDSAVYVALESVFREQREEIEQWKGIAQDWCQRSHDHRAELASLKEEQLTPEEASAILHTPLNVPDAHWKTADFQVYSSALEKLRSLSTTGSSK